MLKRIVKSPNLYTAKKNQKEAAEILLKAKPDLINKPNNVKITALHIAAANNATDVLPLLIIFKSLIIFFG